jgi:hypothetical protein
MSESLVAARLQPRLRQQAYESRQRERWVQQVQEKAGNDVGILCDKMKVTGDDLGAM